ncbi:hypothetical protein B0H19DRAFT_1371121 [Mycena capillaripes]|nr:hypothetical protein B0H19DRAFT_1371121 [Mycena capillaripes]
MVFLPAAFAAFVWITSIFLSTTALVFPVHGAAVWIAPTPATIVAECYPLTVQFTSPVPIRNVSFFYYIGKQGYPGQTIVPIETWPQSAWVNANTVYTAFSESVPVAAGTMIALQVVGWDSSTGFLNEIMVQPNTDASCITSAYQHGIDDYDGFAIPPITTTVSPTTLRSPDPVPLTTLQPPPTSTSTPVIPTPSADGASKSPAAVLSSTPSAQRSSPPSSGSPQNATFIIPQGSTSPTATPSADFAAAPNASTTTSLPTGVSSGAFSGASKHPSSSLIAGAIIAALVVLVLTALTGVWCLRRHNRRRMAEARRVAYLAEPYGLPPPPIREVDAGAVPLALGFGQPERLPPQYDEISGSSSYSQSDGSPGTTTGSGSTKGRTLLLR